MHQGYVAAIALKPQGMLHRPADVPLGASFANGFDAKGRTLFNAFLT